MVSRAAKKRKAAEKSAKVYRVKLRDSVSVGEGGGTDSRPRSSQSGSGVSRSSGGIAATVITPEPEPKKVPAPRPKVLTGAEITQRRRETAESSYEYGYASAAPIKPKPQKRDFPREGIRSKTDFVQDTKERVIGASEELKNFVLGGIQAEVSRGSEVVMTTGGKTFVKKGSPTEKLTQQITGAMAKDTVSEKLFTGRAGEIDVTKPRTQGQILGLATLIAAPVGGKGISKIKTPITTKIQKGKISKLEKGLNLEGQTEKLGTDTFITGGGLESRPEALFVTKFGKGKTKVKEFTPTGERPVTISPKEAIIYGKIDPVSRREMGAIQTGAFKYETKFSEGVQKRIFQKGTFEGEVKEFAKVRETELSNILKKRPERIQVDIKKSPGVLAQTKAERIDSRTFGVRLGDKPRTTKKDLTITKGKSAVFTKQEERLIKQQATPPKPQTKQKGIGVFAVPVKTTQQEQTLKYPKGKTAPKITERGLKTTLFITPKERPVIKQGVVSRDKIGLIPAQGLGFKDALIVTKGKAKITTPIEGTTFKDIVTYKQTTRPRTGTPTKQIITTTDPPPPFTSSITKPPPIEPPRRIPLAIPPPTRYGSSGGGYTRRRRPTKPFVGNVQETKIIGIFNKPEINVGRTRTFTAKTKQPKRTSIFPVKTSGKLEVKIF